MKRMTGTLLGQFSEASWLYEKEIQSLGADWKFNLSFNLLSKTYIYQVAYRVHLLQPFETSELPKESHIKGIMEKHPLISCELLLSHLGEAALCYHLQHWVRALLSDLWWGATLRGAILVYTKGVANLKTCRHHWPRAFNRGKEWFHTLAETVTYNIFVTKILVTNVPKSEQSLTIFPWQSQSKLMCWISVKLCLWYKSDHY